MIKLKPSYLLLLLPALCVALGLEAIALTGLATPIKLVLIIILVIFAIFQSLGLMQIMPKSLVAFALPQATKPGVWKIELKKNRRQYDARLLGSTRVTNRIILLHFESM